VDGIPCIINPAHSMYLFGMEVDWKNGLDARGFIFHNPNASSTCGCGTSFAV
jgi:iron-sulfur cluster assembly protein